MSLEGMSSEDPSLSYLSIYDTADGTRKTSYVVGIHGDTVDALKERASKEYPGAIYITQTAEEWNAAIAEGLIYDAGKKALVEPPAPTEEEVRQAALDSLDSEYQSKFAAIDSQIVNAVTVYQNDDLTRQLREQRTALASEYETKREAI